MCPMLLSRLADGPAMVLSPPQEHTFLPYPRHPMLDSVPGPSSGSFFAPGVHAHSSASAPTNNLSSRLASPNTVMKPSRKRSRDDVAFEEALNAPSMPTMLAPAPARKEKPKARRLEPPAPRVAGVALSGVQSRLQGANNDNNRCLFNAGNQSTSFSPNQPQVDDATRLLGISWQQITTDDSDMVAAVRGWKKYIDKQFSAYLMDSQILVKNRALNAYLVAARPMTPTGPAFTPAFYLFSDDLTQAQLVGSTWETCLQNLRSVPVVFEQSQVLNAADKPLNNASLENHSILGTNSMESGLPLLQTLGAQPVSNGPNAGLNEGVGMGMGMEIDA